MREEALSRALDVFWERGFVSSGLADLTDSMGIGRQSLYDTFGDKRTLFLEALGAYCDQKREAIVELLDSGATPGEGLRHFLDAWPDMLAGPMAKGCLVVNSISESVGQADSEIAEYIGAQEARFLELIESAVQAAIDSGEVRLPAGSEPDAAIGAHELAFTIVSAAHGVALRARLEPAVEVARAVSLSLRHMLGL